MIHVTVVYSPAPRQMHEWPLELEDGATVICALQACGLAAAFPGLDLKAAVVGIWARKVSLDQPLGERDRVEVYRPLVIDPKLARRERFRLQGARAAGLFSRKKPEAKAGY